MKPITVFDLIEEQIGLHTEKAALISDQFELSFTDLSILLEQFGHYFRSLGLGVENKVMVLLPQGLLMGVSSLGVSKYAGCIPLNPESTVLEIRNLIDQLEPDLLVYDSSLSEKAAECTKGTLLQCSSISLDSNKKEVLFDGDAIEKPLSKLGQNTTVAFYLLTSGSTSKPKIVPIAHSQLLVSCKNLCNSLDFSKEDRVLNMMSMFHIGGLLDLMIAPLSVGSSIYISNKISSNSFFRIFNSFKPTWIQAVPTLMADILNYAEMRSIDYNPEINIRFVRSVSSPLSESLAEKITSYFRTGVVEMYGMTETVGLICSNPIPPAKVKIGSVGMPADNVELLIVDNRNNPLKTNEVGKILLRGPNVFDGYLAKTSEDKEVFIDNWFVSGDLGYLDEDGFLFISGRQKEMINRGGEKIAPFEIDQALVKHPKIQIAAAFALNHKNLGEEVAAAIVLKPNEELSKEEIQSFLSEVLSSFKIPRKIYFVDELPLNASGKIQRYRLREQFEGEVEGNPKKTAQSLSDFEQQLAEIWKEVLEINEMNKEDDFFDLGGDSLRTLLLVEELEKKLKIKADPRLIYDHTTIADYAKALEKSNSLQSIDIAAGQKKEVARELERLMAQWPGKRIDHDSLIVGRNTIGSKTPIYWCTNGIDYFDLLVNYLPSDQVVYGLVSLLDSKLRSEENNAIAARIYAQEIIEKHHIKEIIFGGWCEGSKLVIDICNHLQEAGIKVKFCFLQDKFLPKITQVPMILFLSRFEFELYWQQFEDPAFGMRKYYQSGLSVYYEDITHEEFFLDSQAIQIFINHLLTIIDNGTIKSIYKEPSPTNGEMQLINQKDYKLGIQVSSAVLIAKGEQRIKMKVQLKNRSSISWKNTEISGLKLRVKAVDHFYRTQCCSFFPINQELGIEEEVELDLSMDIQKFDSLIKILCLEVDLVEDGISGFSTVGSRFVRFPFIKSRLMLFPMIVVSDKLTAKNSQNINYLTNLSLNSPIILLCNLFVKVARHTKVLIDKLK